MHESVFFEKKIIIEIIDIVIMGHIPLIVDVWGFRCFIYMCIRTRMIHLCEWTVNSAIFSGALEHINYYRNADIAKNF